MQSPRMMNSQVTVLIENFNELVAAHLNENILPKSLGPRQKFMVFWELVIQDFAT